MGRFTESHNKKKLIICFSLLSGSSVPELGASYPGADSTKTQRGGEQRDTEGHWQVSISFIP